MKLKRAFFLVIALVFLVSFTKAVSTVDNKNQTAQIANSVSGQSVTSLVLVNPTTGADITELSNGASINLDTLGVSQVKVRAETSPATVGSVKFNLDQMAAVVKNTSPYVLGPSTLAPGSHTLVVAPYTQARGRGTVGLGRTVSFTVEGSGSSSDPHDTDTPTPTTPTDPNTNLPTNSPTGESSPRGLGVLSFTLVNADTNQDIRKLVNNDTIDISAVGPNINVRAETTASPLPGSVVFDINGSKITENKWPYTLKPGNNTDDVLPWNYTLGQDYIVRADTFTLPRGRGPAGGSLAISFNVVNSGNQTPSNFEVPVNGSNNSGGGSNIEGVNANTVTLLAPSSPGTLNPGQTVDMTCNATVATGSTLNKVQFDWIQPGTNNGGTFYVAEGLGMQYPSFFTDTQQVTVPSILNPGDQIRFRCLAYYNGTSTPLNTDAEPDDTFTIGQQTVGQTTSVSITTPTNNANVLSNQSFNITAGGAPTSDQISKVDFYYQDDLTQPVLLGSDLVGSSFSISHNFLGNRGYLCPKIFAKATLNNQLLLESAPIGLIITDTAATTPMITCEQARSTTRITEPATNAVFPAGTPITVKVQNTYATAPQKVVLVHAGGNVSQNIAQGLPPFTLTVVGTATTPPYNFTHTINTPGFYGSTVSTDIFKAYAYYANGLVSLSNAPVKILPPVNLPTISSAQVVNSSGTALATLSTSTALQVNIGSQGSGFGQDISIKANASTNPATSSVKFYLTGPSGFAAYTTCENNEPRSLFGDSGSTYNTWPTPITLGGYSLTITPYVGTNCTGNAGTAFNTTFLTINNDDVTPPLAPTGVTTTYRSASQIKLSWNSSATATSYKVYRNPTGAGFPANVGSALTFTDTAVTGTGIYTYNVSALDAVGNESGVSAEENPPALSIIYAIGNDVLLTDTVSVKTAPDGTNQTPQQWAETAASIIGGPVYFGGAQYWQLNFPTNPDGWVSEASFILDGGVPTDAVVPIVYETKRGLTPSEIGIIVNTANPLSQSIADYYRAQRGIPAANVVALNLGSGHTMTTTAFTNYNGTGSDARQYALNQLNNSSIQALAFAGEFPFSVNPPGAGCGNSSEACMSITTAFAMGYSAAHTGGGTMTATPYFNSTTLTPRTTHNYIPTMVLAGRTLAEAQQFINQGVQSDNDYPTGKVYGVQTTDHYRSDGRRPDMTNVVPTMFDSANGVLGNLTDNYCGYTNCGHKENPWLTGNYLSNKTDILGYHTGNHFVVNINSNTEKSGAIGEHVTSWGGFLKDTSTADDGTGYRIHDNGQMPITQWLQYGYVASAGTVQEPWCCDSTGGLQAKFPVVSSLWGNYYTGAGALEAYAKSVQRPGQTLFVGDPLANPWKTSQATFSGNVLTIKTTHIKPSESWKLEESTNGTTWTTVQSNITSPNNKYGLKTITVPGASTAKCYRLVNGAVTSTVKIPVTDGATWTETNGVANAGTCVTTGGNPPDTIAPSAPAGIVVSGTPTQTQIVLDWSDSTGNPVGEAVSYNVYRNNGGASAIGTTPIASGLTTSTYTNTALTPGTTYLYQVSAEDAIGNESAHIPTLGLSVSTQAAPVAPNAPTNLTGSASSSSQINLSWIDNATNETTFTLERATNATFTTGLTTLSSTIAPDTTSYSATGLSPSTPYYFRVKAVNATGSSAYATSSAIATPAAGGTGQVMGINGPVGPNLTTNASSCTNPSGGTIYYVDAVNGNDANAGTSTGAAWKTLSKVSGSMSSITAGKMVCFKRGGVYRGRLDITVTGTPSAPIIFDAYGSGSAPIISGSMLVSNWTQHGGGSIYKATVTTPAFTPKYLFVNEAYQTLARQPNTGWYFTNSRSTTSITDSDNSWLPTQTANSLTNGEIVMRGSPWSYTIAKITGNSGSVISGTDYANGGNIKYGGQWPSLAWGYFLRNKLALLDAPGEWYFDSATNTVYLWAPNGADPDTMTVEMSSNDVGFYIASGKSDIIVRNLTFQGQTLYGLQISQSKRLVFENLEVENAYAGIHQYGLPNNPTSDRNIFRNNHIHDVNISGITVQGGDGHLIEGNVVERVSNVEDRLFTSSMTHIGIGHGGTNSNITSTRNIVRDTGWSGIIANGSGAITENLVERPMRILTDGGGITFDSTNNLLINKNIIKDVGVGAGQNAGLGGSPNMLSQPILYVGYSAKDKGLYVGDGSAGGTTPVPVKNTTVDSNVVINSTDAIWIDHGVGFVNNHFTNNKLFNFNRAGIGFTDFSNARSFASCDPVSNSPCFIGQYSDVVTGNEVYGIASYQNPLYMLHSYTNTTSAPADFGTVDTNYYSNPFRTIKVNQVKNYNGQNNNFTLPQWQAASNEDDNSTSSSYTATQPAEIFYNATVSPIVQTVNGCNLTGAQTIQPFSAIVVEYGNC